MKWGQTAVTSISRKRFVILFLFFCFAFQFISNSFLGPEIGLFTARNESFLVVDSSTAWKYALFTLLLPIKLVLLGPFLPLAKLPDLPPPFLVVGYATYWTLLALLIHYLLGKLKRR